MKLKDLHQLVVAQMRAGNEELELYAIDGASGVSHALTFGEATAVDGSEEAGDLLELENGTRYISFNLG